MRSGRRKTVTILFCDLVESTRLGSGLDPEVLGAVLEQYWDAVREVIERHGGTVEKYIGDAVVGVFGVPVVREDDAARAVRAAAGIKATLGPLNDDLRARHGVSLAVRVGVNTGAVLSTEDAGGLGLLAGDAGNVAARLETAAAPDEVLLGEATYRLVRDTAVVTEVAPLTVKGKAEPLTAYRLEAVREPGWRPGRRFETPMVGRTRHLGLARAAYDAAVEDRAGSMLTIVGEAGVGKTRLVNELLRQVGDEALVLRGRCLPYGEGVTFFPIAEMLLGLAGPAGADPAVPLAAALAGADHAERVRETLLAVLERSRPVTTEETGWAFRRLLDALAEQGPVVAVFDDLQWADPLLLDLVDDLPRQSRGAPVLVACVARPELLEMRPAWGGGKPRSVVTALEPLSEARSGELLDRLVGGPLPERVRSGVVAAAEGIPLFVEEMFAMMVDDGLIARFDGSWQITSDLDDVSVPPTVQALLAARLDRLPDDQRLALDGASVLGKSFYPAAVSALFPDVPDLDDGLAGLVRSDVVRPAECCDMKGFETYEFAHALMRDVAYEALPKARRATLHEAAARWLTTTPAARAVSDRVGFHLERAVRYRAELGQAVDGLAEAAARALLAAARRALAESNVSGAAALLGRSAALVGPDTSVGLEVALESAEVRYRSGDAAAAAKITEDVADRAADAGDEQMLWRARLQRAFLRTWTDPGGDVSEVMALVPPAVEVLGRAGDEAGLALAYLARGFAHLQLGRLRAAAADGNLGLVHARRTEIGTRLAELRWLSGRPYAEGDGSVAEYRRWLAEWAAETDPGSEEELEDSRTFLLAMEGDLTQGLDRAWARFHLMQEQGDHRSAASAMAFSVARFQQLAGDLEAARESLELAEEMLAEQGDTGARSTVVATLAALLARLGHEPEAWSAIARSRALGQADDLVNAIAVGSAESLLLARRGDAAAAAERFEATLAVALRTEFVTELARLWADRSVGLELLGDRAGALAAAREALAVWERRGEVPAVEAARRRTAALGGEPHEPAELKA